MVKETILAALRGDFGFRELPEVGVAYDDFHTVILCPVCNSKMLDNYGICMHCGWEDDGLPEDHYSACNGASLLDYRKEYFKTLRELNGGGKQSQFRYYNANPNGILTDDCVKRALCVVTGISYKDTERSLNKYKKVTGAKNFYSDGHPTKYVENVLGAKKIVPDGKVTVAEFCRNNPRGRFILDMKGHWSCCIQGIIYDTWDCSDEQLICAYLITSVEPDNAPDTKKQVLRYCCTAEQISATVTMIRIYDGNGVFSERSIPPHLADGYIRCLTDQNYTFVEI